MAQKSDQTNAHFKYPPFNRSSREIRLLSITHFNATSGECYCKLDVVSLDHLPAPFWALSYQWGPADAKFVICVDGQPFVIRLNLALFLLRFAKEGNLGKPVFVDAVCINQHDLRERESQIGLMRDVYARAALTIGWLGPEFERPCKEELEPRTAMIRSAVLSEYWSRLWIVQELLLSPAIELWLGETTLEHEDLLEIMEIAEVTLPVVAPMRGHCEQLAYTETLLGIAMMRSMPTPLGTLDNPADTLRFLAAVTVFLRRRELHLDLFGGGVPKMPLCQLLLDFGAHRTTLCHDKIYGLLGLSSASLPIDYSIPLPNLFCRVFLLCINDIVASPSGWMGEMQNTNDDHLTAFLCLCRRIFSFDPTIGSLLAIRLLQHSRIIPRSYGLFRSLWRLAITEYAESKPVSNGLRVASNPMINLQRAVLVSGGF
jgi:hypothetical protein